MFDRISDIAALSPERRALLELLLEQVGLDLSHMIGRQSCKLPNGMTVVHHSDLQTIGLYNEIFTNEIYLRHGIAIKDRDCIIDVGANIGLFTLFANQRCKNLKFYAIEPVRPIFEILNANLNLHGLNNVKTFELGLSDKNELAEFAFYPEMAVLSGRFSDIEADKEATRLLMQTWLQKDGIAFTHDQSEQTIELLFDKRELYTCQLKTLSDLIWEQNITTIDLLKVDAEKSELDILKGITGEHWGMIRQIAMEVHTKRLLDQILSLLEQKHYTVATEDILSVEGTDICISMLYAFRH